MIQVYDGDGVEHIDRVHYTGETILDVLDGLAIERDGSGRCDVLVRSEPAEEWVNKVQIAMANGTGFKREVVVRIYGMNGGVYRLLGAYPVRIERDKGSGSRDVLTLIFDVCKPL